MLKRSEKSSLFSTDCWASSVFGVFTVFTSEDLAPALGLGPSSFGADLSIFAIEAEDDDGTSATLFRGALKPGGA